MGANSNYTWLYMALAWYFVLSLLGLAALPFICSFFKKLPDKGYSVSKITGLLITGYVFWIGWSAGLIPNTNLGAWISAISIGLVIWICSFKSFRSLKNLIQNHSRIFLITELVFVVSFSLFVLLRLIMPSVHHTEQPMDLMMLNSLWASFVFPPHDSWLSGHSISYYYFGYWLQITIGKLVSIPPNFGYNLGLASLFAMLCTSVFGMGVNLSEIARRARNVDKRFFWQTGLISILVVVFCGNFKSVYDILIHRPNHSTWWWFSSRSIVDQNLDGSTYQAITEYPAFSFILGDNHPHLHSTILLILIAALALNYLVTNQKTVTSNKSSKMFFGIKHLLLSALVVGAILSTSTWDSPVALLILGLTFWICHKHKPFFIQMSQTSLFLAGTAGVGILLFLPYLSNIDGRVLGILPNLFYPTSLIRFLIAVGPGFLIVSAFLGITAYRRSQALNLKSWAKYSLGIILISMAVIITLGIIWQTNTDSFSAWLSNSGWNGEDDWLSISVKRWLLNPLVLPVISVLLGLTLTFILDEFADVGSVAKKFSLVLIAAGLVTLLVPEIVFLKDISGNRINTIFKFYYQGWILLGITGAFASSEIYLYWQSKFLRYCVIGIILICLPYFFLCSKDRIERLDSNLTLGVTGVLQTKYPAIKEALEWMINNTKSDSVILEAPGNRFNRFSNPLSTFSGRQTIIGWSDHEIQWRSAAMEKELQKRESDSKQIYLSESVKDVSDLIFSYQISYLVVGPFERELYGPRVATAAFRKLGIKVFDNHDIQIFDFVPDPLPGT